MQEKGRKGLKRRKIQHHNLGIGLLECVKIFKENGVAHNDMHQIIINVIRMDVVISDYMDYVCMMKVLGDR